MKRVNCVFAGDPFELEDKINKAIKNNEREHISTVLEDVKVSYNSDSKVYLAVLIFSFNQNYALQGL